MADSRRGGAFWNDPATFDMYATTHQRTYAPPKEVPVAVPSVLEHPSHNKAPLSDRLNYALDKDALALPHFDAAVKSAEERLAQARATREEAEQEGETKAAEIDAATRKAANRPLQTMDPATLPFGSLVPLSETHAAYGVPPESAFPHAAEHAITLMRDNPDAARGMNRDEADHLRAAAASRSSSRPPSASDSDPATARLPSSFRPVPHTGMVTTYQATHVPQPDPDAGFDLPPSEVVACANADRTRIPPSYGPANMWETTTGATYGAHASVERPTTVPASAIAGSGSRHRALRNEVTEYHYAYDRREDNEPREHHKWL
ncbi:uncharacterized protein AMSG_07162 [Thecamonas trahens ATCC 50062]|uniref:Uncharacterized protein n=1 Tax=Thecamonas trahens ATCC 50062 TaxID=461836 RepID=A0A0L0DFB7_THETB|nr:hypothetical protein AMSG_07162 [Thecamonas trahens ATCC 50062]KNC50920.1 hypothetical protein AMSG_07162 [Thecamonas trahens ATCC 50062]|eukprot:XP_013756620.1 hypothetical protein AMSG_07162 [Thecamonas trahens ATCC 50062]